MYSLLFITQLIVQYTYSKASKMDCILSNFYLKPKLTWITMVPGCFQLTKCIKSQTTQTINIYCQKATNCVQMHFLQKPLELTLCIFPLTFVNKNTFCISYSSAVLSFNEPISYIRAVQITYEILYFYGSSSPGLIKPRIQVRTNVPRHGTYDVG